MVTLDRDTVVPVGTRLLVNLPSGKSEGRVVKSVDALAEFIRVVRIGELLSVAKSYAVVHPFQRDSLPAAEQGE